VPAELWGTHPPERAEDTSTDTGDLTAPTDGSPERERQPGSVSSPPTDPSGAGEPGAGGDGSASWRERMRGAVGMGAKPEREPAPTTREPSPARRVGRVSAADSLGDLLMAVGGALSRVPRHSATGRVLMMQSATSGQVIDEAVKGTALDRRLIQPAVRTRRSVESVGAVMLPPLIVFGIEQNPERAPVLVPLLESALRSAAVAMAPAVRKVRKRAADEATVLAELYPEAPPGSDPVQYLVNELFPGIYDALAKMAEAPAAADDEAARNEGANV
jgi:hypothetical protein